VYTEEGKPSKACLQILYGVSVWHGQAHPGMRVFREKEESDFSRFLSLARGERCSSFYILPWGGRRDKRDKYSETQLLFSLYTS
jgi:hypothetical protein